MKKCGCMKNVVCMLCVWGVCLACSENPEIDLFPLPEVNGIQKEHIVGKTDTLLIDTTMQTTFEGKMGVYRQQLYFVDNLLCTIHFLDSTGQVVSKALGVGHSASETTVGQIYAHTFLDNGYLCLLGVSDDVHLFDTAFRADRANSYRKARKSYQWGDKIGYDQFELYGMGAPVVCRSYRNAVFTNNRAEDPTFNYFQTPDIFVREYRNITEQRLDKKETGRLLGRGMPAVYRGKSDTHYLFSSTFFDLDENGNFYVVYMADSLIYKYDKNYRPLYSFGFEGRAMDKDYIPILNVEDIHGKGIAQYKTKGYYTWIEYIDELGYVLRSYAKGEKEQTDGLQIYRDRTLLADVDVPKGFRPAGYMAPYVFSDAVVDEENGRLYVYRMKIQ